MYLRDSAFKPISGKQRDILEIDYVIWDYIDRRFIVKPVTGKILQIIVVNILIRLEFACYRIYLIRTNVNTPVADPCFTINISLACIISGRISSIDAWRTA